MTITSILLVTVLILIDTIAIGMAIAIAYEAKKQRDPVYLVFVAALLALACLITVGLIHVPLQLP